MIIINITNNDKKKRHLWGVQSTLRPYGADIKSKS